MGFWILMLLTDLLTPILMIASGWIMWKHTPKNINYWMGYRTERSMKNESTWKFAHDHCGKLWWKSGWFILIPSLIPMLVVRNAGEDTVGFTAVAVLAAQSLVMFAAIFATESALKKNFDKDGNRK